MTKNFDTLIFFRIGIFLLVSAPSIATFFLLIASISKIKLYRYFLEDNWNYALIICTIFMIIGSIYLNSDDTFILLSNKSWDSNLLLVGLFNWIPFFWCFWSFQFFLKSDKDRYICAILFIAGTIPFLVSGFGQYLFNWHGPFEAFYGLIIWYQRELSTSESLAGMTSVFNNQNYAGAWLSIVFPFSLALILKNKNRLILRNVSLFLFSSILLGIIFTHSRSALGCALITLLFFLTFLTNLKSIKKTTVVISFFLFIILLINTQNFITINFNFTEGIFNRNLEAFDLNRKEIWLCALSNISKRPLLGWGSGSFPFIIRDITGIWKGHTHNIFLELFFSYGIFVGFAFLFFLKKIFFTSIKNLFFNKSIPQNIIDKAWFCSASVLMVSQMIDIQYFDIRISFSLWILLAGLKNICLKGENNLIGNIVNKTKPIHK